jgi:ketosteroid isomerase-like protein
MDHSDDQLTAELYRREVEAWENFRRKDKRAYADAIADDAAGYDLTGTGLKDKAAVVNDVDLADVTHYEMHDYQAHRISDDVALVHFLAKFSGNAGGQPFEIAMYIGEVFVRREDRWMLRWFQNTPATPESESGWSG